MPIIISNFRPPPYLRNGHIQTLMPVFLRRPLVIAYQRERLELEDGDFLDLDWARTRREKVAILSHGLEGSSKNGYNRGMAIALNKAGWDVLAWNFRGCSNELNRLPRFYHSGDTGDLGSVIGFAATQYPRIALIGFSLGGNLTLKYLGEGAAHGAVVSGVAISAPIGLAASALALDQRWSNWFYRKRFLESLSAKISAKALLFPNQLDLSHLRTIRTLREFDDHYTAPLHGFRDATDYWKKAAALQYLHQIKIPALLINARDDPFLTHESFPFTEAERSPFLYLEAPESGGHLGFIDLVDGLRPWTEKRVLEFLGAETGS